MLLVNLCGAPGAGKSTGAAYIFSKLKMKGINAELVTEYAKDKVWENSTDLIKDQLYVFGNQWHRLNRLKDKVDVVITDSPLLLSLVYNSDKELFGNDFENLVITLSKSFTERLNYFINRVKPYNEMGRLQTEEESDELSRIIKKTFINNDEKLSDIDGDINGYDSIVIDICAWLGY